MKPNQLMKNSGFTLVELAIVMIIIGLLIGGVLKGQQLIQNAKINATITEIKGYQAAFFNFKDTYGGVAGDLRIAASRLSGCAAGNGNFCTAGDGNSIVGALSGNIDAGDDGENVQFWKHLALADLITGVDPTADPSDPAWGETFPQSSFRGGWQIIYRNQTNMSNGHVLRLQPQITVPFSEEEGSYPLTPGEAARIDRKLDDGIPGTGSLTATDAGSGAVSGCESPDPYDEQNKSKNCLIFFNIEG